MNLLTDTRLFRKNIYTTVVIESLQILQDQFLELLSRHTLYISHKNLLY